MTTSQSQMLADTRLSPLSVEEALALPASFPGFPTIARVLCIQRTAFYEGAKQGTLPIPLIRVNRQFIGRKVDVLDFLGLQDQAAAEVQSAAPAEETGTRPEVQSGAVAGNDEAPRGPAGAPQSSTSTLTSK